MRGSSLCVQFTDRSSLLHIQSAWITEIILYSFETYIHWIKMAPLNFICQCSCYMPSNISMTECEIYLTCSSWNCRTTGILKDTIHVLKWQSKTFAGINSSKWERFWTSIHPGDEILRMQLKGLNAAHFPVKNPSAFAEIAGTWPLLWD